MKIELQIIIKSIKKNSVNVKIVSASKEVSYFVSEKKLLAAVSGTVVEALKREIKKCQVGESCI